MKKIEIKLPFMSRLDLFFIGFKYTRNFPWYSLINETKNLFFPKKLYGWVS